MKAKIAICVTLAFVIILTSFIPFYDKFRVPNVWEIKDDPFFTKIKESKNEKFFIVGGSGSGQLNSTRINEIVSQHLPNYEVYNLSYNADIPTQRIQSLDSTISAKPRIIFYGISYWSLSDYYNKENNSILQNFPFDNNSDLPINPKTTTLNAIKTILGSETGLFPEQKLVLDNTPFFPYADDQMKINDQTKLSLDTDRALQMVHQNPSNSEQITALKRTIELLEKNNIKIVIFTLPLHHDYLNIVPENDKKLFNETLDEISEKYGVKIYDFTNAYSKLDIWKDTYHIALNPKSAVFSEDVAQMIISEADFNAI